MSGDLRANKIPECYQWLLTERKEDVETALVLLEQYIPQFRSCGLESEFRTKIREFVSQYEKRVNQWQYGVGGETIHRGFYCPSPVRDVVVGNCRRGRKQNRITPKTENKIEYEYGFLGNQLIYVKQRSKQGERFYEYECILYDGNTQYGYIVDSDMMLKCLSKCTFEDGLIVDYSVIQLDYNKYSIAFSKKEQYKYYDKKLQSVTMWDIGSLCRHRRYVFNHDKDGCLSSYQSIWYKEGVEVLDNVNRDRIYKVYERRKV